jgi:cytochrome b561
VICGITAPILIAFHASFKFRGIAGVAFWIMVLVAISGFIGRYLYAQIPRSLTAAELSLTELHQGEQELADALLGQALYSQDQLSRALHVPSPDHIRQIGALRAVGEMIVLDIELPFRVAGVRRASSGLGSKRVLFLGQSQKLLHLWHVIHRPFSYAFAVLAVLHIVVVLGLGFGSKGFR